MYTLGIRLFFATFWCSKFSDSCESGREIQADQNTETNDSRAEVEKQKDFTISGSDSLHDVVLTVVSSLLLCLMFRVR